MSLTNTLSQSVYDHFGDVTTNGGQLGLSFEAEFGASAALWTIDTRSLKSERYALRPTAGSLTVTLPPVSDASFEAGTGVQHGFRMCIKNISPVNSFDIVNSAAAPIVTLDPGFTATMNSTNDATVDNWRIFSLTSEDGTAPSAPVTMQDTYDNSGATTPKIQLDTTSGSVSIEDAPTYLPTLFSVSDSVGTAGHLVVKNTTPTTNTPAIELLSGTSTGSESLTLGKNATTSGAGSLTLTDGIKTLNNSKTSRALFGYNSLSHINGSNQLGTADSDPQYVHTMGKFSGITTSPSWNAITPVLEPNTSYTFVLRVIARDENPAGSNAYDSEIKGIISSNASVYRLRRSSRQRISTTATANGKYEGIEIRITAGGVVEIEIRAANEGPDGNATTMSFIWHLYLLGWTSA